MKNLDKPAVLFFKLRNGEDIIAQALQVTDDSNNLVYDLIRPLKVLYAASPTQGGMKVVFMPWIFNKLVEAQHFTLKPEDIMLVTSVSDYLKGYYWNNIDDFMNDNEDEEDPRVNQALQEMEQERTPTEVLKEALVSSNNTSTKITYH